MEKVFAGQSDCNIFDDIFSQNGNIINGIVDFDTKKSSDSKSLTSCVQYFSTVNDYENELTGVCFGFRNLSLNDELSNTKARHIAYELAKAVDKNSVPEIKRLKQEYGKTKEFLTAKEFLNKKCKQVWDVFENKHEKLSVPKEAMKSLGITNQPDLEFLLADSLKYYEKDNGYTTVNIILSILNNKNLNYTFEDIYRFLKTSYQKDRYKFNMKTVSYLASELDFDETKLNNLGIDDIVLNNLIKNSPIITGLKYKFKIFMKKCVSYYNLISVNI